MTRGGKRAHEVTVVRTGPDLVRLQPGEADPELRRGRRYLVAYIGVMGPQDGVDIVVRAADIVVDRPANGAALACPLPVSGRAVVFEGTVNVRIDAYRPDGARVTAGEGVVTGSGTPPAAPYSGQISCSPPSGVEPSGIVMFREIDAAGDGSTALLATVVPVRLP